jgi:uncharacterized protein (TIGR02284 family)
LNINPKTNAMEHRACIEALNDLIKINNDRIEGYDRAVRELKDGRDEDLKQLFEQMEIESRQHRRELDTLVTEYGGTPAEGTMASGKLYRAWMDVKATLNGGDRETVLQNCEAGEDAAQKAYQMALDDKDVMPRTKDLILQQKRELETSHDRIKALRDAQ